MSTTTANLIAAFSSKKAMKFGAMSVKDFSAILAELANKKAK